MTQWANLAKQARMVMMCIVLCYMCIVLCYMCIVLRGLDILGRFPAIFDKGYNFCDVLFSPAIQSFF